MTAARVPADLLAAEQSTIRKLQILFGDWWPHYTPPYVLRWTLFAERNWCPYCGQLLAFDPEATAVDFSSAQLDHMDPLSRGGDEAVRNALYVCATCNIAKGRRLFVDWLNRVPQDRREAVRQIYIGKHGHAPEAFVPGPRQPRLLLTRPELTLDEHVLRQLFPRPLVDGPPKRPPS